MALFLHPSADLVSSIRHIFKFMSVKMQYRYLWLLGACGCIQASQPPTVDGFFVHKHYIGPVKEQYNTSEHFYCTGGAAGHPCLLQACEHCKALEWCHSFGQYTHVAQTQYVCTYLLHVSVDYIENAFVCLCSPLQLQIRTITDLGS